MPKKIYLDNAAATPIDLHVVRSMASASKLYGNPSSFNDAGRDAQHTIGKARAQVARFLNAQPGEIIFCGSGSEANTLAIAGLASAAPRTHRHIITTPIEHLSVLEPIRRLKKSGWKVSSLSVDVQGFISPQELEKIIKPTTVLLSVMYANNEIGTVQKIARIGQMIRTWRRAHNTRFPLFHVDACQAVGHLDVDVQRLSVDLLTFNGSKIYGPRGVGALFVRRGVQLTPIILGGSQEFGLRAGTENVSAIVGLAAALGRLKEKDSSTMGKLRDYGIQKLQVAIPDMRLNGPVGDDRLPSNINISIPGVDSESLLLELDRHGIAAGSGSACTAHSVEPSHVLKAIGVPRKYLDGVLRFSLSRYTARADVDRLAEILPGIIRRIRARNSSLKGL